MKISVSLSERDLATLDEYAAQANLSSRSAAVQRAIRLLADQSLQDDYEAAFAEWDASEDARLWDTTVGDGLDDAAR
ncbi:MAG: ribbon-helix-helix domain-containing protein [Sporichthyaceae bacterium]